MSQATFLYEIRPVRRYSDEKLTCPNILVFGDKFRLYNDHLFGVSKPTDCVITKEVCAAIVEIHVAVVQFVTVAKTGCDDLP